MQFQAPTAFSSLKAQSEQHAEELLMKLAVTNTVVDAGKNAPCNPYTREHQSTVGGPKTSRASSKGTESGLSILKAAKDRFHLTASTMNSISSPAAEATVDPKFQRMGQTDWRHLACSKGTNEAQCVQIEQFKGGLEAMLAEQRNAVERALAFNTMIAEQLAKERSLSPCTDTTEQVMKQEALALSGAAPEESTRQNLLKEQVAEVERPSVSNRPRCESLVKFRDDVETSLTEPLLSEDDMTSRKSSNSTSFERQISDRYRKLSSPRTQEKSASPELVPTVSKIKSKISSMLHLQQREYHTEDYYKESGLISKIAKDHCFHNLTLIVIVINTVWIAIDTDHNPAPTMAQASWTFKFMDNFFCGFFTFEMVVRFFAFKTKYYAFTDPGMLFDGFLVALMIWDTWVTSLLYVTGHMGNGKHAGKASSVLRIFRIFRLLRLARTGRLFQSVPELMVLAKGMAAAVRSVMVVLSLLALIIYIFSIVFTQLLAHTKVDQTMGSPFQTVPASANFLLLQVLCGFDSDFANSMLQEGFVVSYGLFLIYLLLGSLTIMNMLIGILCDVVTRTADDAKEEAFQLAMEAQVDMLTESLDASGRGYLVRDEFQEKLQHPEVIISLNDMGVDVPALMDFAHFVFEMSEEVSYADFHHMVVQFRGGKPVSVQDIMDMRKQMSMQFVTLLEACEQSGNKKRSAIDGLEQVVVGDSKQIAENEVVRTKDEIYLSSSPKNAMSSSRTQTPENMTSPSMSAQTSPSDSHFSEASKSLDCAPDDNTLPIDLVAFPSTALTCKKDTAAAASSLLSLSRQSSPTRTREAALTRNAAAALAARFADTADQP